MAASFRPKPTKAISSPATRPARPPSGQGGAFIDSQSFAIGISTALSGTGGITKTGSGKLTLSGSNSYQGATVVEGGVLLVMGDNSATGGVFVESGATLGRHRLRQAQSPCTTAAPSPPAPAPASSPSTATSPWKPAPPSPWNSPAPAAGAFDQIAIGNTFTAAGTLDLNVAYAAAFGDTFTIFTDGLTGRGWNTGDFTITHHTSAAASPGTPTSSPPPASSPSSPSPPPGPPHPRRRHRHSRLIRRRILA